MTPEPSKVPPATGLLPAKLAPVSAMQDNMAKAKPYEWKIVWTKVFVFIYLHYAITRAAYLFLTGQIYPHFYTTWLWVALINALTVFGVTAGSHRLWSHRAYKAKWQLRTLLMLCQTLSFQNHIYDWVRDHRVHHKFTDTDADPHNSKRGFFFAHMGWLLIRKHPEVGIKGATIDFSDLERDPIVMFQKKYYLILVPVVAFAIPTLVPTLLWGESIYFGWYVTTITRYVLALHATWLVNSAAHIYGTRPIDKSLSPTENAFVAYITFGEGWHNYHHVFPWDYKAAELGNYKLERFAAAVTQRPVRVTLTAWMTLRLSNLLPVVMSLALTGIMGLQFKGSYKDAVFEWRRRNLTEAEMKELDKAFRRAHQGNSTPT
ncbi:stearoyl-CoA desaturase 5-like isoform X2 [Thrips palmi]|uniref:Stearoyl-CoA desaturase 5-like isoform X2 n=1 Tax=Thrips palmi TaxID=161013 RepID=A0A6P8Z9A8_THRPL|nr:stearoyl-CoA desaturase 5-like isoform X2 [Thrips palmi]